MCKFGFRVFHFELDFVIFRIYLHTLVSNFDAEPVDVSHIIFPMSSLKIPSLSLCPARTVGDVAIL